MYKLNYTPTPVPPPAPVLVSSLQAAKVYYDKKFIANLKRNTAFSAIDRGIKRRKKIVRALVNQYSDYANFSDIAKRIDLSWRGHIRRVSTIPANVVYDMLYVDKGQEW